MISRTKKNRNRIKHSIRQTGGITLLEGKYAFFVNKKNYETLFGKPIIGAKAPSIKDIEKNFNLNGYYIKNHTNTLHLIGWDKLTDDQKKKKMEDYNSRLEFCYPKMTFMRKYLLDEKPRLWVSDNPLINIINSINLDDLVNVEQYLKNIFNYDRIIPVSDTLSEEIYKYCSFHLNQYPTVEDSYFCIIIEINNFRPNKYLYFIENDINIIKEQDEIDKENKKRDEENKRIIEENSIFLEKLEKLEESPSYHEMLTELSQFKISIQNKLSIQNKKEKSRNSKRNNSEHFNELSEDEHKNMLQNKRDRMKQKEKKMVYNAALKTNINRYDNEKYYTIINKYEPLIENEVKFNNENYRTLEDIIEFKENNLM